MDGSLDGKVALVTGVSSGIGAATAAALLNAGARVAVTARRVERLRELGQQLGAGADRWLAIEADVRREADAGQLVSSTVAWGRGLNILVNNAGLSRGNLVEGASTEDLRLMMETNLFALSNLSRLALPALKKSRGDLVNISSTAATAFTPGSAFYAAR